MIGKNVLYYNTKLDLRTPNDLRQIIAQFDSIINELLTVAPTLIANVGIAEYDLDTGQTKTRVRYNSMQQLTSSVKAFEDLREFYLNKLENLCVGRVTQFVDQSNFRR